VSPNSSLKLATSSGRASSKGSFSGKTSFNKLLALRASLAAPNNFSDWPVLFKLAQLSNFAANLAHCAAISFNSNFI
jgi:hypothetical protein